MVCSSPNGYPVVSLLSDNNTALVRGAAAVCLGACGTSGRGDHSTASYIRSKPSRDTAYGSPPSGSLKTR
jgi:hypothetical protein